MSTDRVTEIAARHLAVVEARTGTRVAESSRRTFLAKLRREPEDQRLTAARLEALWAASWQFAAYAPLSSALLTDEVLLAATGERRLTSAEQAAFKAAHGPRRPATASGERRRRSGRR